MLMFFNVCLYLEAISFHVNQHVICMRCFFRLRVFFSLVIIWCIDLRLCVLC